MEEQSERRRPEKRQRQEEEGGGGGEEEADGENVCVLGPSLPTGRVKKIMKLDREVKKVTSEALFLISLSTDLFLRSFASRARDAALARKRRSIKLEHLHSAARSHSPTSDFLLDSLPRPSHRSPSASRPRSAAAAAAVNALPPGARRIDDFFRKPSADPQ